MAQTQGDLPGLALSLLLLQRDDQLDGGEEPNRLIEADFLGQVKGTDQPLVLELA